MPARIRSKCRNCKNYMKNQPKRFTEILIDYKVKCMAGKDVYADIPCTKFEEKVRKELLA
jgi:hypothetical protein